ncbi:MAG: ABC transporter ATP-binding protein/permease [Oscillospiraceae bacterium]|nr:ABC transporter ATP-binding protein/permease [Oscillospiraceae bacterium]
MLELKNIVKKYGQSGETEVTALDGVSVSFRRNEFVAILGHSGCGKTTLLNIIGGLDHYTSGDLVINGRSTKEYKDPDWDTYRNHSIGFIFQSYNLIPHQNVLANVELALTVSGVSKAERRERAVKALERVGLGDQLYKKPNQMSGGQMQRVAIARALVNNPDVLLADEPTGALDTETSIQVMELLKEIAADKLVIMVTHNPELADTYATRIVKIKDGRITGDTDPFDAEEEPAREDTKKHVSMSFGTAVSLSFNNLLTKKGRTLLTAFAGSIGIIGIALILSLSTGINDYINGIQEETLSSYPLTINQETTDTAELLEAVMKESERNERAQNQVMYANTDSMEIFNSYNSTATQKNDLKNFKEFLDTDKTIQDNISAVKYYYNTGMQMYTKDSEGKVIKCDVTDIYAKAWGMSSMTSSMSMMTGTMSSFGGMQLWTELVSDSNGEISEVEKNRYELIYGEWPDKEDEIVLILSENNEVPEIMLYALGFKDTSKAEEILSAIVKGDVVEDHGRIEWDFDEVVQQEYKAVLPYEFYTKSSSDDTYINITESEGGLEYLYNSSNVGIPLKIVGIIRPSGDVNSMMDMSFIGYTNGLTNMLMEKAANSELIKAQAADSTVNKLNGLPFMPKDYEEPDNAAKAKRVREWAESASEGERAELYNFLIAMSPDEKTDEADTAASLSREDMEQIVIASYVEQMGAESEEIVGYIKEMDDATLSEYVAGILEEQSGYAPASDDEEDEYDEEEDEDIDEAELSAALDTAEFPEEVWAEAFDEFTPDEFSESSYDTVMDSLGYIDPDTPTTINIYAKTFEKKDRIAEKIEEYNNSVPDEQKIKYTDYVALLMSSITDIISGISYLLIAFVAISLVVSSIMIGIITYISVLERTREIGILRAIGASKKDVANVFNAETLIVGFTAGLLGIVVSFIAIFPINALLYHLTEVEGLKAVLPWKASIILVLISMTLTLIAGIIPSGVAAKKDPVEALRTE